VENFESKVEGVSYFERFTATGGATAPSLFSSAAVVDV
jgi:hypothetical protein